MRGNQTRVNKENNGEVYKEYLSVEKKFIDEYWKIGDEREVDILGEVIWIISDNMKTSPYRSSLNVNGP